MVQKSGANQLRLVVDPIIYRLLYIPGGAGFLPSTVGLSFSQFAAPNSKSIPENIAPGIQPTKFTSEDAHGLQQGSYLEGNFQKVLHNWKEPPALNFGNHRLKVHSLQFPGV